MALGTDLVVGSAPPEKAGSAAAMSETSTELGLALGVAVLGGIGAAVYRQAVPAALPADLSSEATSAARDSIEAAVTAVAHLPPAQAEAVLAPAREVFTTGLNLVAGIGAVATLAVLALVTLLRRPPVAEPAPAETAEQGLIEPSRRRSHPVTASGAAHISPPLSVASPVPVPASVSGASSCSPPAPS
jgi:MFS transporter, DHA2 family, multidrug resistance protein